MKLQLNLLSVAAVLIVGCAPDAPSSRSAVTIGCVGKEASNPKCKTSPATSGDASGLPDPAGNPSAGNPSAGNPVAGQPPAAQEPPAPQPAPKPQPDFLGEIIKIIGDGVKSGGSGGNADAGAGGNAGPAPDGSADAGAGGNADAGAGGNADSGGAPPPPPPATSSVSLTTKSGTYIKKSATSVGSTWVDGKDYCLVSSGATFTAQCIASYNDTHYKLKGSSACSGLTASYILKSGLNPPSKISSSCP